jgi:hypothetical protein
MEVPWHRAVAAGTGPQDLLVHAKILSPTQKSLELLGTEIQLAIAFSPRDGAPLLAHEAKLAPEYCENPTVAFEAQSGELGATNTSGGTGGKGGDGEPGRDLRIEADNFVGPDGRPLILAAITDDARALLAVVVHDPAKGVIRIQTWGGVGGRGGRGRNGNFGWGCVPGPNGGSGGNGGRGGNVTLVLGNPSLQSAIRVNASGGVGGGGGSGGVNLDYAGCSHAVEGGEDGRPGGEGRAGPDGKVTVAMRKDLRVIRDLLASCARCVATEKRPLGPLRKRGPARAPSILPPPTVSE